MKQLSRALVATALALAAGASFAGQDLGDGPGSYTLTGSHDASFYVDLGPGTYIVSGDLGGPLFNDVWLSTGGDTSVHGANDLTEFLPNGTNTAWNLDQYVVTLDQTTRLFVNVDLKKKVGDFEGNFTIVSAPVPEPATGAMLAAGLAVLGFMGRRRRG